MDGALTIPTTITTKADFDKWLEKDVGDKLTSVQKDALKTDISSKLGLDLGNAITAYGRAAINADLQYFHQNPNATNIPKLDSDLKPGDAKGPNQFNQLRDRANMFSDPFLIDLTAVLALMHETSEKLRSATKELREAEHSNAQMQMQAAAEDIKSQGMFQALSGGLSAAMSIAGGAAGLKAAGGGLKSLNTLNTQAKAGLDDGMPKMPKLDDAMQPQTKDLAPKTTTTTGPQWKDGVKPTQSSKTDVQQGVDKLKTDLGKTDGTTKSNGTTKTDGTSTTEAPKMTKQEYDLKLQEITLTGQQWQAYSTMIDGIGKALGGSFQGVATQYEAAKALHDKEAADAQHQKEATGDLVKTLADFSNQIRQTIQAIQSSQEQAAHRVANV